MAENIQLSKRPDPKTPQQGFQDPNNSQAGPETSIYSEEYKALGQQKVGHRSLEKSNEVRSWYEILTRNLDFHGELIFHTRAKPGDVGRVLGPWYR